MPSTSTIASWSARNASLGKVNASAAKAGSRSASASVRCIAAARSESSGPGAQPRRQFGPIETENPHRQRDQHRRFFRLPGRRRYLLLGGQLIAAGRGIPPALNRDLGRPRLLVPELELAEVDAARILHGGDEIL